MIRRKANELVPGDLFYYEYNFNKLEQSRLALSVDVLTNMVKVTALLRGAVVIECYGFRGEMHNIIVVNPASQVL